MFVYSVCGNFPNIRCPPFPNTYPACSGEQMELNMPTRLRVKFKYSECIITYHNGNMQYKGGWGVDIRGGDYTV